MSEPIKIRATVKGTDGEVRVLLPHPMEAGSGATRPGRPCRHTSSRPSPSVSTAAR
jgi:hypothetical protein